MNIQNIHLDIQCSNPACKGFNYFEDETGYYICADCNTISQIRCGLELDYTAPIRSIRSKVIKSEEDDNNISDDGILNENNDFDLISQKLSLEGGDTIMNISTTNVKSSRLETSSFNDYSSICSKSIKKKFIQIKTPQEILIEIQRYFENIINVLVNDFFEKKEDNINNNYLKNIYFNKIINFGENEKKIFYGITRRIWIYFVTKKYKVIENPIYKKKKLIRSRINSIDEEKEIKKNKDNENEHIKGKINKKKKVKNQKVKRLHEQLKMRRITERNIYNIYNYNNLLSNYSFGKNYKLKNNNKNNFYNENNFNIESQKKIYLKKFIEEYDQVINFIKKDKCFDIIFETEEEKEKINITNVIEYEQLIRVCEELGINTKSENNIINNEEEELNFETLIHLIYKQQINYEENNIENNQLTNGINSNHFLFLIYEIFHYNKIPLLLNDILFNYKNFFYINQLSLEEINYLFLLNFKKFKAHINWFDNNLDDNGIFKKAEAIIEKICNHIFKMPKFFTFFCKYILKILHNNEKIKIIILTKYIIEYICIGIIFYSLKVFYGLNDLPYICLLLNNINKNYFNYNNDIDLKEEINIYQKNTKNDKLCNVYSEFPSELDIIKILINELKKRKDSSLLINNKQRKLNYSNEYKKNYIDINLNYLYKNFYDDFTSDINQLEKKYIKKKNNNTINNKNKNKKSKKSWKILKTKEFDNKVDNIENPIKIFNPFIKEEINFQESVYKNKDNNVEFPLPFDTYIRMKKHSQKILINYHRPSEMIFIYLICEFFKIDYLSLRSLIRLVEYYIEKIYNQ
jgi:hypothetical protein